MKNKDIIFEHFKAVRNECKKCGAQAECEDCVSAYRTYLQASMFEITGSRILEKANKIASENYE